MIRVEEYPFYEPQSPSAYAKMQFGPSSFGSSSFSLTTWSHTPPKSPILQTSPHRTPPQQTSPHSYSSQNLLLVCRNWGLGKCVRGEACRYVHIDSDGPFPSEEEENMNLPSISADQSLGDDDWNLFDHKRSLGSPSYESSTNDFSDLYTQSISPSKKECWDWIAGRCSRGPTCKFSHDYASFEKQNKFGIPTKPSSIDNVCHQWSRVGQCQYGDLCKFSHTNSQLPQNGMRFHSTQAKLPMRRSFDASANAADLQSLSFLSSVTAMSPQAAYRVLSSTNTEICRFYAKHGRCKYSNACKFFHIHPVHGLQLPNLAAVTAYNNQLDSKSNTLRQYSSSKDNDRSHYQPNNRNQEYRPYGKSDHLQNIDDDSTFNYETASLSDHYSHSQSPRPAHSQSQSPTPLYKYGFEDAREIETPFYGLSQDGLDDGGEISRNLPKLTQMSRNISIDDISDSDSMFYAATNSALSAISDSAIDSSKFSSKQNQPTIPAFSTTSNGLEYDMSNLTIAKSAFHRSDSEQSSDYQLSSALGTTCTSCGAKSCVYVDIYRTLCWRCCPCVDCGQSEGKAVCSLGLCNKCYQPHNGERLRE